MKILITGAAGMIGRKLTARLCTDGRLGGREIEKLILFDIVPTEVDHPWGPHTRIETGDLRSMETVERLIDHAPDVIFHLAATVSGEAEKDLDKGYGINLQGTQNILSVIRSVPITPRFVFASSIAVFGAPFPETVSDEFFCTPLTSYGTQKAICELLIGDYSRREIIAGIAIRLPTICVRPGSPNAAASGFLSSIIREPLVGKEAVLPVSEDLTHWLASPRAAVGFLLHAATIDLDRVGARRALMMPGLAVTVAEQIQALREIAGDEAAARIRREPNDFVRQIVSNWPRRFDTKRAVELGFRPEDVLKMGRTHLQDAVPMTLGQEFVAFAQSIEGEIDGLEAGASTLLEMNMGGTAVGTGLNAPRGYSEKCAQYLCEVSGFEFKLAPNLVEATQDTQGFVLYSSTLRSLAVKLCKICNDLRLLTSGPRAGLGEIRLPERQPGSSIMPGKVNPVIPEVVNQICFKIMGNDLSVSLAAHAGQLQLNVMEPVIAASVLESIRMMMNGSATLRRNCIEGIEVNRDHCQDYVDRSIGVVTALVPVLGYKPSTELAAEALRTGRGVVELVREKKLLSEEQIAQILAPDRMARPLG